MNKKGKFYSNNKPTGISKVKDSQQKSNQKQILNRSMERRRKIIPLQEQTSEKYSRVKVIQNKPKKVKIEKKINIDNRNEKSLKRKEYANTMGIYQKKEENSFSPEKEKKYFFPSMNNYEGRIEQNNSNTNLSKYNENILTNESEKHLIKRYKNKKEEKEDYSYEEEEEKNDDLIYRTLYRTSKKNIDALKEKEEIMKKNKEKVIKNQSSNKNNENPNDKFVITMEQTENLQYNNENKKNNIISYNNKNQIHKQNMKKPKQKINSKEKGNESNINRDNENLYSPKKIEKKEINNIYDTYINERVIDLFVIDDDFDIKGLTKSKKIINRKNNKFKEISIENYGPNMPLKKEKFTGFIFIRKSKGKKIYKLELPDDIEQINDIFKNETIMIKNQIIQIIPLNKITLLNNQNHPNQQEVKKSLNEKYLEKELEKEKEIIKDKERQIILLKNKNEELNNIIKKQIKQITQAEKDIKNIKLSHDQLKDSYQSLDQENKALKSQIQAYKIRRKSIQMQEEESYQRTLQEMKDRIQKYKNVLRKPSVSDEKDKEKHRKSILDVSNINNLQEKNKNRNSHKDIAHIKNNKKKEEQEIIKEKLNEKNKEEKKDNKIEEEENYEDDYNYDIYDEKDPKAKKMKNAMARFRKKYKDIIIENKKNLKIKEKEEKEKEETEKKELDQNSSEEENSFIREKEELERKEKEEKERKEREEQERKEKEKKEREKKERERKEKEEKEKKEKEKNKLGPFGGGKNKIQNNFSKTLADKMKFGPMPGGLRKVSGGIDYNPKPQIIIEKKIDVVNLIGDQPFKRKNKKKPTRKTFMD